jgi:hypothetical protein
MRKLFVLIMVTAIAAISIMFVGCGKTSDTPAPKTDVPGAGKPTPTTPPSPTNAPTGKD